MLIQSATGRDRNRISPRWRRLWFVLVAVALLSLYGWVGYTSFGFDDEFFNIALVEGRSLVDLWNVVQATDVHPPLSYVLNAALLRLTGDWSLVRLFTSLILAVSIIWYSFCLWSRTGWGSGMCSLMLIGFCPSLLMWGTSLRWYALYLILLLWLLAIPARRDPRILWGWPRIRLVSGLLLLGYTSYTTLFLAIPVAYVFIWCCGLDFKSRVQSWLASLLLFGLLYSHQLIIFLTVHYPNRAGQSGTLLHSLGGLMTAEFSNQGVFPLSLPGVISAAAMVVLMLLSLFSVAKRGVATQRPLVAYGLSLLILVISGLAGKFRNFVVIDPLKGLWLSSLDAPSRRLGPVVSWVTSWSLAVLLLTNLWGVANVALHRGTTKNNWNLPVAEGLARINDFSEHCAGQLLVVNHEQVFQWNLEHLGYRTLGPFATTKVLPGRAEIECLVVIDTFRGAIDQQRFDRMMTEARMLLKGHVVSRARLGFDPDFGFKQLLDPEFPAYSVEMTMAKGRFDFRTMQHWNQPIDLQQQT